MVFRVQQILASVPATAATNVPVAVATPERWPRKLRARSFRGEDRSSLPLHGGHDFARVDASAFVRLEVKLHSWIDQPEGQRRRLHPGENASPPRAITWARAIASGEITARDVTSPPDPRSSSRAHRTTGSMSASGRSGMSFNADRQHSN